MMPRAVILLDWDRIKGPVVKAKYPEISIDPDLPMLFECVQIRLHGILERRAPFHVI